MDLLTNPILFLIILIIIGLIAGFVVGIMGGSGVIVVVPLLILLGYDVHESVGMSLFVDVIASLVAAYVYWKYKHLDLSRAIWMAIAAIIGAQIGSLVAVNTEGFGISWGFGVYLIITGSLLLKTGVQSITEKVQKYANSHYLGENSTTPEGKRKLTLISAILGLIS